MRAEKTRFTCPDCAGSIEKVMDGPVQYRCRVGHAYSPQSALAAHRERQENTLWSAVVLLEEGADLAEEVSDLGETPQTERAKLEEEVKAKRELADQIRAVVNEVARLATSSSER